MSSATSVTVKWLHEGAYRRFKIDLQNLKSPYNVLENKLRELIMAPANWDFTFGWQDEENDLILIATNDDLEEALCHMNGGMLRIQTVTCVKPASAVVVEPATQNNETPAAPPTSDNDKKDSSVPPRTTRHAFVVCDGCDGEIVGARYKCMICKDYDLCEKCESKGKHDKHPMVRSVDCITAETFFRIMHRLGSTMRRLRTQTPSSTRAQSSGPTGPTSRAGADAEPGAERNRPSFEENVTKGINYINTIGSQITQVLSNLGIDATYEVRPPFDEDENKTSDATATNPTAPPHPTATAPKEASPVPPTNPPQTGNRRTPECLRRDYQNPSRPNEFNGSRGHYPFRHPAFNNNIFTPPHPRGFTFGCGNNTEPMRYPFPGYNNRGEQCGERREGPTPFGTAQPRAGLDDFFGGRDNGYGFDRNAGRFGSCRGRFFEEARQYNTAEEARKRDEKMHSKGKGSGCHSWFREEDFELARLKKMEHDKEFIKKMMSLPKTQTTLADRQANEVPDAPRVENTTPVEQAASIKRKPSHTSKIVKKADLVDINKQSDSSDSDSDFGFSGMNVDGEDAIPKPIARQPSVESLDCELIEFAIEDNLVASGIAPVQQPSEEQPEAVQAQPVVAPAPQQVPTEQLITPIEEPAPVAPAPPSAQSGSFPQQAQEGLLYPILQGLGLAGSVNRPAAPEVAPYDRNCVVGMLVGMGFDNAMALYAVEVMGADVDKCVEFLVEGNNARRQ